ncbi:hypothetical protein KEM55_003739 [Ascosphaera atra]|nr:hypothetical protein KEM55_003739 [Ascosphaera atra]
MFSRSASTVVASSARPEALRLLSAAQSSSRTFSSTALFRAENDSSSDPAARRAALENAAQGSSSTSPSNNNNNANPRGIRILRVPSNFGQNLRARSPAAAGAAASAGAGPGNAGPNGPLVRPPSSFKLMKNLQRMGGARLGGPGGGPRGPRGPRGANAGGNRKPQAGRRGAGAPRRRRKEENYGDEEDEYANLSESQTEALLAKIEAERPKPVRYNPQGEAKLATLAPTWPALPIGRSAEGGSSEGLGLRTVDGVGDGGAE